MRIGIPKEIMPGENRVAAIPETVGKYARLGFGEPVSQQCSLISPPGPYATDGREPMTPEAR
jgi:hypothetical protein